MRSFFLICIFFFLTGFLPLGNPNALWEIIGETCVPHQKSTGTPDPCAAVVFEKGDQGFAVYKDRNGPLQYLLLPTTKIAGIESPEILETEAVNYFDRAWEARTFLEQKFGGPIAPEEISLTVNSQVGRSQNQLHIHISCTRPDIKTLVQENLSSVTPVWTKFPGGVLGHDYWSRRLTRAELKEKNIFRLLAEEIPEAALHMNEFGLAVMAVKDLDGELIFVLFADRAGAGYPDNGHIEDIQDHTCPQLYP